MSSLIFNDLPKIRELDSNQSPYPPRGTLQGLIPISITHADEMVLGDGSSSTGWNLANDIFNPGNANASALFDQTIFAEMGQKKAAGNWNVTLNDL